MKEVHHIPVLMILLALVASAFFHIESETVRAASMTNESDVMNRQAISVASNHTITFVMANDLTTTHDLTVGFDLGSANFDLSGIAVGDIDLEVDDDGAPGDCDFSSVDNQPLAASATATDWGVSINTGTDLITFDPPSTGSPHIDGGDCVRIEIGTNAAGGAGQITNPSSGGSYKIDIDHEFNTGAPPDKGRMAVSILEGDTVTIEVEGDQVNVFDVDTDTDGCATALNKSETPLDIDLGTLSISGPTVSGTRICFDLDTNAQNGAIVTVTGNTAGLFSAFATHTINADTGTAETLSAGDEGFGFCVDSSDTNSGTINAVAPYNGGTCTGASVDTGGIDTVAKTMINTGGDPVDGGAEYTAEVRVIGSRDGATPNGADYTVDATFAAVGSF